MIPHKTTPKQIAPYNTKFYDDQIPGSLRSARYYAKKTSEFLLPRSVIDFGCGRGTWLKAFHEIGSIDLVGLDGVWNSQNNMIDPAIRFKGVEFDSMGKFSDKKKYDLAISCEVAEHLKPQNSEAFIEVISQHSDVVIFGAAYTHQGGVNHINERRHSFWASIFKRFGFTPFDLFRPFTWGSAEVDFWYQQNTFLYVKQHHPIIELLKQKNVIPIVNIEFMNCVHPYLFDCFVNIREKKAVQLALKLEEGMSRHPRILKLLRITRGFLFKSWNLVRTTLGLKIIKTS